MSDLNNPAQSQKKYLNKESCPIHRGQDHENYLHIVNE